MTKTTPRAKYTLEFKLEAVRLVEVGQSITAAARTTQRQPSEVRLHRAPPTSVADLGAVPGAEGARGGIPRALGTPGQPGR